MMKIHMCSVLIGVLLSLNGLTTTEGFQSSPVTSLKRPESSVVLHEKNCERRDVLFGLTTFISGGLVGFSNMDKASASVFLDPAMYGDQELRVAAVDSLREKVRQAILKDPKLAPSFYQLALLDGLSFQEGTKKFGPDGTVVRRILSMKKEDSSSSYLQNLKEACLVLVRAQQDLRKYTAVTIGDAVAIGGAESIKSIGGPILPVQLGRTEPPQSAPPANVDIFLFDGGATSNQIQSAFRQAGLTEREMTALLGALLTLERVEKSQASVESWKRAARPKFREAGKLGRMSDFKRLTDEDLAAMEEAEEAEDEAGWYIADSFGTREQAFGQRIGKDEIDEKSFNKFLKELNGDNKGEAFGYIEETLLDNDNPTAKAWLNKYAGSNLSYIKDLGIAYNAVTQLGAEYTGGKYESLLKNRPRKSLNDDDLKLFN